MSTDRSLVILLRSLQSEYAPEQAAKLLQTAASLLVALSNPRNITVLTSQVLIAPAIWKRPDGLGTCLQVLRTIYSASLVVARGEQGGHQSKLQHAPRSVDFEDWVLAVTRCTDAKAPRWRHLLVLGGLLLTWTGENQLLEHTRTRQNVAEALVEMTNLVLDESRHENDSLSQLSVALVANYSFELLSEAQRRRINYDALLSVLMRAAFFSEEGFHSGYFLGILDADIIQVTPNKFTWSPKSTTYIQLTKLSTRPLMMSMGPLSRLIGHSIEYVKDPSVIYRSMEDLLLFSKTLKIQWRLNKLSEIDASEETTFLDKEALTTTISDLWKVLKAAMFASINILRAILSRTLADPVLAADSYAPSLSALTLHTLRNLFFITSRLGPTSFTTAMFTSLVAIDNLSHYPDEAESFLTAIRPSQLGAIPAHPLDRCLDHFFLNTAEHFTAIISPTTNQNLLVAAATPYLGPGGDPRLHEIFEAAHSVLLAVIGTAGNAELAMGLVPGYVDVLFKTFPANLSARQFRLAYKTLIRISSPPSPLSTLQPDLASTLLELLRYRATKLITSLPSPRASAQKSPPPPLSAHLPTPPPRPPALSTSPRSPQPQPVSLPSGPSLPPPQHHPEIIYTLALLDCLPHLTLQHGVLQEWLPLAAELVRMVREQGSAQDADECVRRFWDVLSNGEMDPERARVCVAWWTTEGGREEVLGDGRP